MLEIGSAVRYRSLGAGRVTEHTIRDFQGSKREFAVISFPHRDMTAQIPIGDPDVNAKLHPVAKAPELKKMLRCMEEQAEVLPRSWDIREEQGKNALQSSDPSDWVRLLGSYALADGSGVVVAASDHELVRSAEELLAAELSCACNKDFEWAEAEVRKAYQATKEHAADSGQHAEHFAAVTIAG